MKRRIPLYWITLVLALLVVMTVTGQMRLVTSEYTVQSPQLPEGFHGWRVLQLSDLHGAQFGPDSRRLIAAADKADPDIIALTGDLIDEESDIPMLEALIPRLCEIAPCYYVTGNHEWALGQGEALKDLLESWGVTVLDNRWLTLERAGDSILLCGVEDPNAWADMPSPDELVAQLRQEAPDAFTLLLGHRNYWLKKYPKLDVDVILCGHAHGGLFRLPGVGGLIGTDRLLFPTHTEGAIRGEEYTMVVSRGLGNVPGSFRLLNPPELVVVKLEKS